VETARKDAAAARQVAAEQAKRHAARVAELETRCELLQRCNPYEDLAMPMHESTHATVIKVGGAKVGHWTARVQTRQWQPMLARRSMSQRQQRSPLFLQQGNCLHAV